MTSENLRYYPIFSLLEPEFMSKIHMVFVYGSSEKCGLIVTKDGILYALGNNKLGGLGIGDSQGTLYPTIVEVLSGKDIKTFAYGSGGHVLALTSKGEVYSWGCNTYRQLGHQTTDRTYHVPTSVHMNLNEDLIVDIACGTNHTLALTANGKVYAWGKKYDEETNSNSSITNVVRATPTNSSVTLIHCILTEKFVCISCGDKFSVAVKDNGEVYSWGDNSCGQLGLGNTSQIKEHPSKVTALAEVLIKKVVCGYGHCLALSDEGNLYVWGANNYGQLGLDTNLNVYIPVKLKVPEMRRVLDIAAFHYGNISVAMGDGNLIFMWGHCLGLSIKVPTITRLKSIYDAQLHSEGPSYLNDCVKQAFDDPSTSDLTIQVQGKPIHVHKFILKIRCEYFKTMLQEPWEENKQCVIKHELFSYDTYRAFLKYLYTDDFDLPLENTLELLKLADAYNLDQLKSHCTQVIIGNITVENVLSLYTKAIAFEFTNLKECCFNFAVKHMIAVIHSLGFVELDASIMKDFVIKAIEAGAFKT
ncbi:RCC1 and BTB domain-containing protein 1 [Dufourea novaeangliae]|uniref:RCC1 and BTB domain-containing protein 1 n=1 Tax=Dufourea novaeangliae TaxID=178035 RepID=A0A154PPP5_DUFNO|nr:RCC1 and BTB domain-containing protein 1 [Dufourea novaeangliae]